MKIWNCPKNFLQFPCPLCQILGRDIKRFYTRENSPVNLPPGQILQLCSINSSVISRSLFKKIEIFNFHKIMWPIFPARIAATDLLRVTTTVCSQWRVLGGPLRPKIFSFLCRLSDNVAKSWVVAPPTEILDPPLVAVMMHC